MSKGYNDVRLLFRNVLRARPSNWRPVLQLDDREIVHSWSAEEFAAYVEYRKKGEIKNTIEWIDSSFSKICLLLGCIEVEERLTPSLFGRHVGRR